MSDYQYRKLVDKTNDLRLVNILPGVDDSPIKLLLSHVSTASTAVSDRAELKELQTTLPPGWECYESMDGRYVFAQKTGNSNFITWTHPDKSMPTSRYELPPRDLSQYEALSYTWGSWKDPVMILMKDSDLQESIGSDRDFQQISIRRNLAEALKHLRYPDVIRTLWTDALCINQADDQERGEQVGRMASIYRSAQRVVIWLGPAENNSTEAMRTLEHIGKQTAVCDSMKYYLPCPDATEPNWFDYRKPVLPYESATWQSIQQLASRPWFSRRWIVQESKLANHHSIIMCGQEQMSWGCFKTAAACLLAYHVLPRELLPILRTFDEVVTSTRRLSWPNILDKFWYTSCEDDRDKVYALLGICPPTFRKLVNPDYSLPVMEVYRDAIVADIRSSHRLESLLFCSLIDRRFSGPTWVSDLSRPFPYSASLRFQFSSGYSEWFGRLDLPDEIIATGVECAIIQSRSVPLVWDMKGSAAIAFAWFCDISQRILLDDDSIDMLVKTLCCNSTHERHPDRMFPTLQQWKSYFQLSPNLAEIVESNPNYSQAFQPHRWLLDFCSDRCDGRSLFVTEDGTIGLCPSSSQTGDIICVLLGLESPIAIRQTSSTTFRIVGECLVNSLIDSMALLGPLSDPWRVEYREIENGGMAYYYVDGSSGLKTFTDPRLGSLDEEWDVIETLSTSSSPELAAQFCNKLTGKKTRADPRLTPEILAERGVCLKDFTFA